LCAGLVGCAALTFLSLSGVRCAAGQLWLPPLPRLRCPEKWWHAVLCNCDEPSGAHSCGVSLASVIKGFALLFHRLETLSLPDAGDTFVRAAPTQAAAQRYRCVCPGPREVGTLAAARSVLW